jgi:hypothetical protein
VVEDCDVAVGHVGDGHGVVLIDQPDECPAHADDVIVGVRAEDEDGLGLGAGRVGANSFHHVIEDQPAEALGWAVLAEQLVQLMLTEVVVGKFQEGLADLLRQPDHRPANESRRPLHRADPPGAALGR